MTLISPAATSMAEYMQRDTVTDLNKFWDEIEADPTNWIEYPLEDTEVSPLQLFKRNLKEGKDYRHLFDGNWQLITDFYKGRQTPSSKAHRARIVDNIVNWMVESLVPYLTGQKPKLYAIPPQVASPQTKEYSTQLELAIDSTWQKQEMQRKLETGCRYLCLYGTVFFKVLYDPDLDTIGDIAIDVIHPSDIVASPIIRADGYPEYIIESKIVSPEYLAETYGVKGIYAASQADTAPIRSAKGKQETVTTPGDSFNIDDESKFFDRVDLVPSTKFSNPPSRTAGKNEYPVLYEMWCWDPTLIDDEYPIDDKDGKPTGESLYVTRMKYPYGRVITVCGDVILQDGESPYKFWPYTRVVTREFGEFWGTGFVEGTLRLQKARNEMMSLMLDIVRSTANPVWIVDDEALDDESIISNRPGLVVRKRRGTDVHREPGQNISNSLFAFSQMLVDSFARNTGASMAMAGGMKKGTRGSLESFQEMSLALLQSTINNLDRGLTDIGKKIVELIRQYYSAPRMMMLLDPQEKPISFEFDGRNYMHDNWSIQVSSGASQSVNKTANLEKALKLYQVGAIDQTALLDAAEFPNKDAIMERMNQANQAKAQAEMQAKMLDAQLKMQEKGIGQMPLSPQQLPQPGVPSPPNVSGQPQGQGSFQMNSPEMQ